MQRKRNVLVISLLVILTVGLYYQYFPVGLTWSISVSSDGHYALSAHENHALLLWDLHNRTYHVISRNADPNSTYFIPYSDRFIWQTPSGRIVVENVKQQIIKQISTGKLNHHFSSLVGQEHLSLIKNCDSNGILVLDRNSNAITHRITTLIGNCAVTLDPKLTTIVGGDEQSHAFIWDAKTGKRLFQLYDIFDGKFIKLKHPDKDGFFWRIDKSLLTVMPPKDWIDEQGFRDSQANLQFVYIDQEHYLRFITYVPFSILYQTHDPKPLKYLPLGRNPFPNVSDYRRADAIASSWQAHVLVVGQAHNDGILVYQYQSTTQQLTLSWIGNVL